MIEIDGSAGEGGGQVLRSSLALSLVTGKAFHLRNVRARRPKPGLQPQHLMSVRAAARVGNAEVRGAALRSSDLTFVPGTVAAGRYHFPIGTAGATGLVLQTVYLPLALAKGSSELILEGGTHVSTSPCFHFLATTWRAYLAGLGIHLSMEIVRPGFYPRGGGLVEVQIQPCSEIQRLQLTERSRVTKVTGFSAVAGLPEEIAKRQDRRATFRLRDTGLPVALRQEAWSGGPGTVLGVELDTKPAPTFYFGLGARGKPAEAVADEAADQALAYLHAVPGAVDEHSADQIVLPLALASGGSSYSVSQVTLHLLTNIAVIRQFIERDISCTGAEGEPGVVRIA